MHLLNIKIFDYWNSNILGNLVPYLTSLSQILHSNFHEVSETWQTSLVSSYLLCFCCVLVKITLHPHQVTTLFTASKWYKETLFIEVIYSLQGLNIANNEIKFLNLRTRSLLSQPQKARNGFIIVVVALRLNKQSYELLWFNLDPRLFAWVKGCKLFANSS